MVHGTAVIWLPVTDMQRSMSFYRDTLSLEAVRDHDD
jgi:catechol 2,3-dioxygenase-like lactoylglutathione lyase family enzyme